jgi:hypothetical protein
MLKGGTEYSLIDGSNKFYKFICIPILWTQNTKRQILASDADISSPLVPKMATLRHL